MKRACSYVLGVLLFGFVAPSLGCAWLIGVDEDPVLVGGASTLPEPRAEDSETEDAGSDGR